MSGTTASNAAQTSTPIGTLLCRVRETTISSVRTAAFWAAVLAPLAYLTALHSGVGGQQTGLFLGLLVVHIVCVVVGHDYSPRR